MTEVIVARFKSVAPTEQRASDGSVIWDAHIEHPEVRKAGTKFANIARQASDIMFAGKLARITLDVRERNVNGTMRKNYYLREVEEASAAEQAQATAPSPNGASSSTGSREFGWKTDPEDAWRMALTSGSERAVQTLPMMPVEQRDFETQKQIATAWADFIISTPRPLVSPLGQRGVARSTGAPGAYDEPEGAATHDAPPPHSDDDIPF